MVSPTVVCVHADCVMHVAISLHLAARHAVLFYGLGVVWDVHPASERTMRTQTFLHASRLLV